jgi:hypothetical protein
MKGRMKLAGVSTFSASCAGLTRASIHLRKSLSKKMDCRVKPGNDEACRVKPGNDGSCRVKPGNDDGGRPGNDGAG